MRLLWMRIDDGKQLVGIDAAAFGKGALRMVAVCSCWLVTRFTMCRNCFTHGVVGVNSRCMYHPHTGHVDGIHVPALAGVLCLAINTISVNARHVSCSVLCTDRTVHAH